MTPNDLRRLALALPGTEEHAHMGSPDFRVGGRIFATLSHVSQDFGNLMLTPEQQAASLAESPGLYLPAPGAWGRNGVTHIRLALASESTLAGALHTAWQNRLRKNQRPIPTNTAPNPLPASNPP